MAVLSRGNITGPGSADAVASIAINGGSPVTLPERTLLVLEVVTYHSTPASLRKPTVTGTGGETWVEVGTRTVGGASPNRRVTRFRSLVTSDTSSMVTIDCAGVAQTGIGWWMDWVGGVVTTGTHGAGAVGQTIGDDSGTSSVTSISEPFAAMTNLNCGYVASFVSSVGGTAITPRVAETYDVQVGAHPVRVESQFNEYNDTAASCSGAGSGLLMMLATEIVAPIQPAMIRNAVELHRVFATATQFFLVSLHARSLCLLHVSTNNSYTPSVSQPGVTWTLLHDSGAFANGYRTWVYRATVPADAKGIVAVTAPVGGTYLHVVYAEIGNVDLSVNGTGIIQSKEFGINAGPNPRTLVFDSAITPGSVTVCLMGSADGTSPLGTQRPGWQGNPTGQGAADGYYTWDNGGGSVSTLWAVWRANEDATPDVTYADTADQTNGIALEMQSLPYPICGSLAPAPLPEGAGPVGSTEDLGPGGLLFEVD